MLWMWNKRKWVSVALSVEVQRLRVEGWRVEGWSVEGGELSLRNEG